MAVACPGVMDPLRPFDKERRRFQEKGSHWHAYLWGIRLDLVSLSTPLGQVSYEHPLRVSAKHCYLFDPRRALWHRIQARRTRKCATARPHERNFRHTTALSLRLPPARLELRVYASYHLLPRQPFLDTFCFTSTEEKNSMTASTARVSAEFE